MKTVKCSLTSGEKDFNKESARFAREFLAENGLIPISVRLMNSETIQIKFRDDQNDDLIMRVLTSLFEGLGGVEIDWDLFPESPIIF